MTEILPAPPVLPSPKRNWVAVAAVAAAAAVALGGLLAWRWSREPLAIRSLAVLPFQMLGPGTGEDPVGLGLTDAVIARLGSVNRFIVRPTGAVREFDRPQRDPLDAGRKLAVEAVLDASIQKQGDSIRVIAQLIRTADGRHLWADTFDMKQTHLFALEDELASRVSRSLSGLPTPPARYQPNPEAHRLYTVGRHHRNRWNPAGQRKAIEYFEKAVALDPNYALAHAGLADSWMLLAYFFGASPDAAYPKADRAAREALRLDGGLSEAHHSVAVIRLFHDWNWKEADLHLRRALEINPNNPDSLQVLGVLQAIEGRNTEGIESLRKAAGIDPTSAWRQVGLAFQYACAKRLPEAIEASRRAHELDPALGAAMNDLFLYSLISGREKEAVEWHLKSLSGPGSNPAHVASLRDTFDKQGIRGYLRARIERNTEQIRNGRSVSPMMMAQLTALLGEREEAVKWIGEAVDARHNQAIFVGQLPTYDKLRDHPEFQRLVRRMGL